MCTSVHALRQERVAGFCGVCAHRNKRCMRTPPCVLTTCVTTCFTAEVFRSSNRFWQISTLAADTVPRRARGRLDGRLLLFSTSLPTRGRVVFSSRVVRSLVTLVCWLNYCRILPHRYRLFRELLLYYKKIFAAKIGKRYRFCA